MRPDERRETGQKDLFRSRLDAIIDMKHPLVQLGGKIDWSFLEQRFGAVYEEGPGRPPLPTRLMAGLAILGSGGPHNSALDDDAAGGVLPQSDEELSRHRHDRGLLQASAIALNALLEPQAQRRVRLMP